MKIISGAQTGADQGGLEAAEALGFVTGGSCPMNCKTEDGLRPDLIKRFHLKECGWGYEIRTENNVRDSDATLIFGRISSRGSHLTVKMCEKHGRRYYPIPFPKCHPFEDLIPTIVGFIKNNNVKVLNVAGNRESINKGIQHYTKSVVSEVLRQLEQCQ